MTGSGIFAAGSNGDAGEAAAAAKPARTAPRQVPKSVLSFCLDRHFCLILCGCVLHLSRSAWILPFLSHRVCALFAIQQSNLMLIYIYIYIYFQFKIV